LVGKLKLKQPPEILFPLETYAENPKGFLVLTGKNGTGKSFAAKEILSFLGRSDKFYDSDHYLFISQTELFIKWHHQLSEWKDTYYLIKEVFNKVKYLVLDDIGTRRPSDAFMDFIYQIIDYRWSNNLCTIITTNLTSEDVREKFGDAFLSRVGSGVVVEFEGEDRRLTEWG